MKDTKEEDYNLKIKLPKEFDTLEYLKAPSKNPLMKLLIDMFYREILNQISRCYSRNEHFKLLDIGCGVGLVSKIISQNFSNATISGFDVSEDAVKSAKLLLPSADIKAGDIYDSPFNDKLFDMIICAEVLEHLNEPEFIIDYIARVCKKYAIISIPNNWKFRAVNVIRFKFLPQKGNTPGHVNEWTKQEISTLLSRHFRIIYITTILGIWIVILCEKIESVE
jgi:2-polyprenyl-3-methyl-5-hydroxy-6-metoxy-1,4-benzoquinol methylase